MWPVNMAQKAAKEKKNRERPLWARARMSRGGRTAPQSSKGRKLSSTMAASRQAASWGRMSILRPARYWVVNRASRRMGRAWVQQAERWLYR